MNMKNKLQRVSKHLMVIQCNLTYFKQLSIFFLMILIGIIFFLFINHVISEVQWYWYWKLLTAYFFPPAGKETILPAGFAVGIPHHIWFISIWFFDILVCVTMLTNWWLVEIIVNHCPSFPFIGIRLHGRPHLFKKKISIKNWYNGLHERVQKIEQKKYGRILPIFLIIFMLIPFQGSGALTTCFLGTWLGFRRRYIILIVLFGSFFSILFITLAYNGLLEMF